jgi:hypothetical protein
LAQEAMDILDVEGKHELDVSRPFGAINALGNDWLLHRRNHQLLVS